MLSVQSKSVEELTCEKTFTLTCISFNLRRKILRDKSNTSNEKRQKPVLMMTEAIHGPFIFREIFIFLSLSIVLEVSNNGIF